MPKWRESKHHTFSLLLHRQFTHRVVITESSSAQFPTWNFRLEPFRQLSKAVSSKILNPTFWGRFFSYFHEQNKLDFLYIVCTKMFINIKVRKM